MSQEPVAARRRQTHPVAENVEAVAPTADDDVRVELDSSVVVGIHPDGASLPERRVAGKDDGVDLVAMHVRRAAEVRRAGVGALADVEAVEVQGGARSIGDQHAPLVQWIGPQATRPFDERLAPGSDRQAALHLKAPPEPGGGRRSVGSERDRGTGAVQDEPAGLPHRRVADLQAGTRIELHHGARLDGERRTVEDAQVAGHDVRTRRRRPGLACRQVGGVDAQRGLREENRWESGPRYARLEDLQARDRSKSDGRLCEPGVVRGHEAVGDGPAGRTAREPDDDPLHAQPVGCRDAHTDRHGERRKDPSSLAPAADPREHRGCRRKRHRRRVPHASQGACDDRHGVTPRRRPHQTEGIDPAPQRVAGAPRHIEGGDGHPERVRRGGG